MARRIFIACPISKFFVGERKLDPEFKSFIQGVQQTCRQYSSDVFLALERELFGDALMDGVQCTPLDYAGMKRADDIIAFPEDSQGVAVEIGWASALNKRLLVFTDQRFHYSPLVSCIHTVCNARVLRYEHQSYAKSLTSVLPAIHEFLDHSVAQPSQRAPSSVV
jgi:hypothetical protein